MEKEIKLKIDDKNQKGKNLKIRKKKVEKTEKKI